MQELLQALPTKKFLLINQSRAEASTNSSVNQMTVYNWDARPVFNIERVQRQ